MNQKKLTLILLIIILTFSILTSCARPVIPLTAAELLDLGERYLLELNFRQALVQFLAVIEIEPMIPRGYTGAAEAHVGLGDIESAIAVLRLGLERLPGNEDILGRLEALLPAEIEAGAVVEEVPGDDAEPEDLR